MEKEWYEKEEDYERRWNSGRVDSCIWKYIPKKLEEAVSDCYADADGYWIHLDHEKGGWSAYDHGEDCASIHEYTISDLKAAIKTIKRSENP